MLLTIGFYTTALFQQHQLSVQGTDLAVQEQSEVEKTRFLGDLLDEIGRYSDQKEILIYKSAQFRKSLDSLRTRELSQDDSRSLNQVREAFDSYVSMISKRDHAVGDRSVQARFDRVSASVRSFEKIKVALAAQRMDSIRREQSRSLKTAASVLALFALILVLLALNLISFVTAPLTRLSSFLDEMKIEDDLPQSLPDFGSKALEVSGVVRSFEQLLHRLNGYRALNIKRLLIEKRRADVIAAAISDGIFLLRGHEILYVNPVGERILGLPKGKTWKGMNVVEANSAAIESDPKSKNLGVAAVLAAISQTIPVEMELQYGDRKQFYLLQSYPISEQLIEQVEHSMDNPVDQVLERWQATTLILAQDVTLVRESQEAKSHFIATLSHEVKTPVTSLTMATRLLKRCIEQIPNPTHKSLILTCSDDVDRLRVLIEDLLSVSRFDTLTQRLEIKNVDMSKLLKQSVQHFQTEAFERGVEIVTLMNTGMTKAPLVPMDATKVSWAISNLLINALRHTPRGGRVESSVSVVDGFVQIRIRDSGPGIDRNRQERLFDKFNPFYDLRVARSGTVGMGLAIAREIITAHGGRIWVVSEPGHGAEFYFTLPLERNAVGTAGRLGLTTVTKGDSDGTSASSG